MDSLAGNPDISRQMIANNPMFVDNPKLREQMVTALSAMMEKMRNPEVQALMQNRQVLKAITQVFGNMIIVDVLVQIIVVLVVIVLMIVSK